METTNSFESKLHAVNEFTFADIALEVFRFQATFNPIYKAFIDQLSISPTTVSSLEQVPFLPISFFKTHLVKTGQWIPETTFASSGTTNDARSSHLVQNLKFYLNHAQKNFEYFFGPLTDYHILALLPSYLERPGSSLIAMMTHFIQQSNSIQSAFYLNDYETLLKKADELRNEGRKIILWGVSFALLDLAERFSVSLNHCMVFETGGMKGRRKEITRLELGEILHQKLNIQPLYSEYGMTELLSQAYSKGDNRFLCPPWMRILCRDLTDPFSRGLLSETGGINVIDLANWQTISFVETEDLGKAYPDGSFEILGRLDNSDVRGCNLMVP